MAFGKTVFSPTGAAVTKSSNPANPFGAERVAREFVRFARLLELPPLDDAFPLDANCSSPERSVVLPPTDDAAVHDVGFATFWKSDPASPFREPNPAPRNDPPPVSPKIAPRISSLAGDATGGAGFVNLGGCRPMEDMGVPPPGGALPPPKEPNKPPSRGTPKLQNGSPPVGLGIVRAGVAPGGGFIRGDAKKSLAEGAPGVAEGAPAVVAPEPNSASKASPMPREDGFVSVPEGANERRPLDALGTPPCFIAFMGAPFRELGALRSKSSSKLKSPLMIATVGARPASRSTSRDRHQMTRLRKRRVATRSRQAVARYRCATRREPPRWHTEHAPDTQVSPARVATSPAAQPTCENYNLYVSLIDIVEDSFAKTVNKLDGFD